MCVLDAPTLPSTCGTAAGKPLAVSNTAPKPVCRMASQPPPPSRYSLVRAFSQRLPPFLGAPGGSRRVPDFSRITARTPDLIRRVLRLEPKRRMSEVGMTSITEDDRDSIVTATSDAIDRWQPDHRQRELLKLTWSDDFEYLYNMGTHIYAYIFHHEPLTKLLFPAVMAHGDAWRESKEFRSQALKFVQTLSQTVCNVHHMDRVQPLLYNVGRAHIRFAERGFRPQYWDLSKGAIKSALADHIAALTTLTDQDRVDAVEVWYSLSDYIVHQMRKGYMDALADAKKKSTLP